MTRAPHRPVLRALGALCLAASAVLGVTAVGAAVSAVGALPAAADPLTLTPASGSDLIRPTIVLSGACPVVSTSYFPYLYGPGLPDGGQPMANMSADTALLGTGLSFQTDFSFKETAAKAGATLVAGTYLVRVDCLDELTNVTRAFTRTVTFTSATAYVVGVVTVTATPTVSAYVSATPTASITATPSATPTSASPSPTASPTVLVTASASATPTATPTASRPPTPSPTVVVAGPVSISVVNADGVTLPASPLLRPGQRVTVRATGFLPSETIGAVVRPSSTALPGGQADSAGAVDYGLTVPPLAAGQHVLELRSASRTVSLPFLVPSAFTGAVVDAGPVTATGAVTGGSASAPSGGSLAATGGPVGRLLALSGLLLVVGGLTLRAGSGSPQPVLVAGRAARRTGSPRPGRHVRRTGRHSAS